MKDNVFGRKMEMDRMRYPVDEVTGLPFPVIPFDTSEEDTYNYHHTQWPRRLYVTKDITNKLHENSLHSDELTLDELAGLAVRMSRGQILPVDVHTRVHQRFDGPEPPKTIDEKFDLTIRACSGLVSRWGVDLWRPNRNLLVYMDDETFYQVANRRALCTERAYYDRPASYRRYIFGSFIMRYTIAQDLSHISGPMVREFLGTRDDNRRKELGCFILKQALESRLEPIIPLHEELQRSGNVQPGKSDLITAVKKHIPKESMTHFLPVLAARLSESPAA